MMPPKSGMIIGVDITPLKIISHPDGDIYRALRSSDDHYHGFEEAYFSTIHTGKVKAWKRHKKMTLNLIVPIGSILFVIYDDRPESPTSNTYQSVILSRQNYCRLSIEPMLWVAFKGIGKELETNMLLNIANLEHDPSEADRKDLSSIPISLDNAIIPNP